MEFTTKDSGQRQLYSTGMQRDVQDDKPAFDLIMPEAVPYEEQMLTRWAELMRRGANKYTDRNWELASTKEELDRFRASALRHCIQWFKGETDEDHAAAVYFNIQGAEYVKRKMELLEPGTLYEFPITSTPGVIYEMDADGELVVDEIVSRSRMSFLNDDEERDIEDL